MKLWKKLSLITAAAATAAVGLSGAAVIHSSFVYHEKRAAESCMEQLCATANALGVELENSNVESFGETTKYSYTNYLIRKYGAQQYILLQDGEEICNLTEYRLTPSSIKKWQQETGYGVIQTVGNKRLFIVGKALMADLTKGYSLVLVSDISEAYGECKRQAWLLFLALFGCTAVTVPVVFFATEKILKPLGELKDAALDIRNGNLGRRANVRSKDEVGVVADAFNGMAGRMEAQVEELAEVSERRRLLLGSMAHELKTPMTSIIGYSDTLLHVHVREEQRQSALTHIYEEGRRLERLSAKLMSLIGLYENESIVLEKTDMGVLFERVRKLEEGPLAQRDIRLEVSCRMQEINGDSDLLESLLINLIDNAAKASAPGTVVRLLGKNHEIVVQDEGFGMPKEEIARVTEAFYMVDKARSRKAGGCGLGLALCGRIAKLHGAQLIIESEQGKGTIVRVRFED